MLINIEDNTQQKKDNKKEYAIGIDLGTTNSLISYVNDSGVCEIIPINQKNYLPSILFVDEDSTSNGPIFVGYEAVYYANLKNKPYIKSIKRCMGQSTKYSNYYPQELSAEILKKLKFHAEDFLQTSIKKAVITIPAYFDDNQRNATMQAASLAGLEVLRLISEPTAAALSYGLDLKEEGKYLVYDLGGGTFDISLLQMQKGIFNVIATKGDTNLGGDDFDTLIKDFIANHLKINQSDLTNAEIQYLLNYAKAIKENFHSNQNNQFKLSFKSKNYDFNFSKEDFKSCVSPLINKTIDFCQDVLNEQNINLNELNGIILVGGSTLLPLISELLIQKIPTKIINNLNPQDVVALGAGYLANSLIGKSSQHTLILDVLPLSLGIELFGDLTEKIILRNSKIPVSKSQEFTTQKDNQTKILINIVQGERELASKNRSLGKIVLSNLTPQIAGKTKIVVNFTISQDGILTVTATDKENKNNEIKLDLKPTYGLSLDEMTEMLYDSIEHSEQDIQERLYKEQTVTAEYLINLLKNAIKTDKDLLTKDNKTQIEESIYTLEVFIAKNQDFSQVKILKQLINHLEAISNDFAEKRMTNSIEKLLTGKKTDDILNNI